MSLNEKHPKLLSLLNTANDWIPRAFVYNSCHVFCNKMHAYALYGIQPIFLDELVGFSKATQ